MNKKLIVLGQAFYGMAGLTLKAEGQQSLISALKKVTDWQPDQPLRNAFLTHIRDEHIVPGSWQNPDDQHLDSMASRILTFIR